MAAKEQVVLFVLPPNTTHLTQPLDKGCFGPLKMKWEEVCHKYTTSNSGKVVNRFVFCKLLNEAWTQSMSSSNIMAAFKTTGVYPPDRTAITVKTKEARISMKGELGFIPLCSPVPRALEKPIQIPAFTQPELKSFHKRYETEAANVQGNTRYQQWIKMYHPEQVTQEKQVAENETITNEGDKVLMSAPTSTIEKFFLHPLTPQTYQHTS